MDYKVDDDVTPTSDGGFGFHIRNADGTVVVHFAYANEEQADYARRLTAQIIPIATRITTYGR